MYGETACVPLQCVHRVQSMSTVCTQGAEYRRTPQGMMVCVCLQYVHRVQSTDEHVKICWYNASTALWRCQSFLANCQLNVYKTRLSGCFATTVISSRNYSASKMDFALCKTEVCLLIGCLTSQKQAKYTAGTWCRTERCRPTLLSLHLTVY